MGRPIGAQNKDKPFRDALRVEAASLESGPKKPKPHRKGTLRWNARKLLMNGSPPAIREIADRLDGRVPQAMTGIDDGPIELSLTTDADRARALAALMAKTKKSVG
jgi:hypothetical protein